MVVVNQPATDAGGWTVNLYCSVPGKESMSAFVCSIAISAPTPNNPPCRVAEVVTLPSVRRWSAEVIPPSPAPARTIAVGLVAAPITSAGPQNVAP
jgi:hypothetical protein